MTPILPSRRQLPLSHQHHRSHNPVYSRERIRRPACLPRCTRYPEPWQDPRHQCIQKAHPHWQIPRFPVISPHGSQDSRNQDLEPPGQESSLITHCHCWKGTKSCPGSEEEWLPYDVDRAADPPQPSPKPGHHPTKCLCNYPVYVKNTSESIGTILAPLGIWTSFQPTNTLQQVLVRPKDPVPKENRSGVIYQIPCSRCPQTYIGQTSRTLGQRLKEQ